MADDSSFVFSPELSKLDRVVLRNLVDDVHRHQQERLSEEKEEVRSGRRSPGDEGYHTADSSDRESKAGDEDPSYGISEARDAADLAVLRGMNDPSSSAFEPTVISSTDLPDIQRRVPAWFQRHLLRPYIAWAQGVVRHKTDVVMLTHLTIYLTTSVPSAVLLFRHFTWLHGVLHFAMQFYYMGAYTLMMHQHIHQRGILAKRWGWLDHAFPYLLDPLMGHTWNSYCYHHKHHHIEGNGPADLSSTLRYQRDSPWNFACYVARFFFLIWLELPLYYIRKGRTVVGLKAGGWELANYAMTGFMLRLDPRAAIFVFVLPFVLLRIGLMVGNWGQHAFVDADEPDSDFRSSITLIDVPSNRYCYNDGYHTSHHLNPMRHWRDHPAAFLKQKGVYGREKALVFYDIDYLMITVRVLMKDYAHLARRLVPMGEQIDMSLDERAEMLRRDTRAFSEDEIRVKFGLDVKGR